MGEVIDINKAAKEDTVTLTYADMMEPAFVQTISKMLNMPTQVKLGARLRHWLGRYSVEIQKHMAEYNKGRTELLEKYAKKGDDGKAVIITVLDDKEEPIIGADGNQVQKYDISDEDMVEFNKEFNDLTINSHCNFPFYKIKVSLETFPEVLLSHEMIAMERIIEWQ